MGLSEEYLRCLCYPVDSGIKREWYVCILILSQIGTIVVLVANRDKNSQGV
jgi:hypothetical protein